MVRHHGGFGVMRRWMLLGLVLGCASTQPARSPAQGGLRAETDAVLALRAPTYAGTGEKDDALRFVKSEIGSWAERRRRLTDELIAKYEAARAGASGEGVAALYGDVAELLLDLCQEFLRSGIAARRRC